MSAINTINLPIDEKAHSYAKIYSALLSEEYQRKRAYASILSLFAFINVLAKEHVNIQKSMTLFRNPIINEQYEIADLYVNNWHLDVRVVNETDAVLVPKIHYESGIVPDFYVVVKIDSALENAELVGFADTSKDLKEAFDYHYFKIPFASLINYDEFLSKIRMVKQEKHTQKDYELFQNSYLSLMDGGLDTPTKNEVLKHLFKCSACRTEFCCFTGFEMVSCNISKYPDVLDDKTLDIIGAQSAYDEKYEGQEEVIYIGDDEPSQTEEPELQKDGEQSDILDEIFSEDENKNKEESGAANQNKTGNDIPEIIDFLNEAEPNTANQNKTKNDTPEIIDFLNETEPDVVNQNKTENDIPAIIDILDETKPDTANQNKAETDLNIIESDDDISATIDTQNDMEIIEEGNNFADIKSDSSDVGVELLEQDNNTKYNDMEIIGENTVDSLEDESDMVVINEENNDNSELEFETDKPQTQEVQKVIVDYDDTGEPIYSYITNVDQEEAGSVLSEVEPLEEESSNPVNNNDFSLLENDDDIKQNNADKEINEAVVISDNDDYKGDETSLSQENTETISQNDNVESSRELNKEYFNSPTKQEFNEENEPANQTKNEELYSDTVDKQELQSEEHNQTEQDTENNYEEKEEDDFEEYDEDSEEHDEFEKYETKNSKQLNRTIVILLSLIITVGLIGAGAFFVVKGSKNKSETASAPVENIMPPDEKTTNDMFEQPVEQENGIEIPNDNSQEENQDNQNSQEGQDNQVTAQNSSDMFSSDAQIPSQGTIPVPPVVVQQPSSNGDVNKVIANAFNQPASGISLKDLNWFCTAELFSDPTFKNYLQNLDNLLKQNIRNNIMGVMQAPPNDYVAAKFAVDNNGNLQRVIISESSGSEQIDNIVLQSIKESFEGEKSQILNDSTLKSDMYYLKVVIKL